MSNIIYPEIDVLFEGEDTTHRAKFVQDKPNVSAVMYCAADTNFYIDYKYLSECSKNHEPARIPMKVIAQQKEWENEKEAFESAWFRSKDVSKPELIKLPPGFNDEKSN